MQRISLPLKARLNLDCLMAAEPLDDLQFTWYLNNSHNERRVVFESAAPDTMEPNGSAMAAGRSQLRPYLLESELDYGRLYCVARNSLGPQRRACVYQLEQSTTGPQGECCLPVACN